MKLITSEFGHGHTEGLIWVLHKHLINEVYEICTVDLKLELDNALYVSINRNQSPLGTIKTN